MRAGFEAARQCFVAIALLCLIPHTKPNGSTRACVVAANRIAAPKSAEPLSIVAGICVLLAEIAESGRPEHFTIGLIPPVSLPGLTGQSSIHGRWLLDRPVKPGDDSTEAGQPNRKM